MRVVSLFRIAAVGFSVCAFGLPVERTQAADFYAGKSLSVLIGYSAGGGYDLYARLLARHIGKQIPGQPSVLPQSMTGAGSLRAANFLYNAAPKDGTMIGTFARGMAITPLLGAGAQFDGTKFTWLGSMTTDVSVCLSWHTSAIKTWKDMLEKPSTFGGEGPGSDPDIFTLLYQNVFGSKARLVTGYHGTADIGLAMERGEVDGLCGISWSTVKSQRADWLRDKKINVLVQASLTREPDLPNVPMATDFTKTPEQAQILKLMLASQRMARPFAAPPAIPTERKDMLVAAFDKTMKDPEFLAEAKKLNLDINPVSAREIDVLVKELYQTPPDVIKKAAAAIIQ